MLESGSFVVLFVTIWAHANAQNLFPLRLRGTVLIPMEFSRFNE